MRWNRRLGAGFVLRVAVIGLLSCGRVHPQQEGSYALFVTGILRDGCNLQSTLGMTFEGTLFLAGNIAWFQLDDALFGMQLRGNFKENIEQFHLDGSVANISTPVQGTSCLVDEILIHLEAITDDANNFHGSMRLRYVSLLNSNCLCELWANYRAVH